MTKDELGAALKALGHDVPADALQEIADAVPVLAEMRRRVRNRATDRADEPAHIFVPGMTEGGR